MTKEEMAKAYAEGFAKEYREIAYDAFLCGFGAKCTTEIPNDLEEAGREYAFNNAEDGGEVVARCEGFVAGDIWQKEQMMKEAVEGLICATITGANAISFLSPLPKELTVGDKVRLIIIKED